MDTEIKGGLWAGFTGALLWVSRFPSRVSRLEERYEDSRSEIADVKQGIARVESKMDQLTAAILERL